MILAGTIALWTATAIAWAFVLVYAITAPWYRSEEGSHLMSFTGFLAVVMAYFVIAGALSTNVPQFPLPRLIVWVCVVLLMAWRFSILVRWQIVATLRKLKEK